MTIESLCASALICGRVRLVVDRERSTQLLMAVRYSILLR
jgi:hypothetical protein